MSDSQTLENTVKAIHALACLRHFDTEAAMIQVVIGPWTENRGGPRPALPPGASIPELAETCEWSAQVRLGGGKWGHSVGPGRTQMEAAQNLLRGYVEAHDAVDRRRAEVFERLPALQQYRFLKGHAVDKVPAVASSPVASTDAADFATWVEVFSGHMLAGLMRNAHKGPRASWLKGDPRALVKRVYEEMDELRAAVDLSGDCSSATIWGIAASVALMAGMVADSYAARHGGGTK